MSEASGIPSWCRVGAKVVAVGMPNAGARWPSAKYPRIGGVYTIRRVKPAGYGGCSQALLMLHEIDNSHIKAEPLEPGFPLVAFRPLATRSQEQDVAIFRPILDQVPVDA